MDQLLEELRKDMQVPRAKFKIVQKKPIKAKKKPLVSKITPAQTNAMASMVEQMQL